MLISLLKKCSHPLFPGYDPNPVNVVHGLSLGELPDLVQLLGQGPDAENIYFINYFFGKQKWVWRFWVLHPLGVCEREARLGVAAVLLQGSGVEVQLWEKTFIYWNMPVFLKVISGTHCHPPVGSQPWSRGETQCPLTKRKPLIFKYIPFVRNHRMNTWSDK